MKTLKKTLCLVLAMVMVFGLCAVSASAKLGYGDTDDITYKEAVDVMSGIGILSGDSRGFRPTADITRAEAAKIMAYIIIGNAKQADAVKATSDPFVDVPASHWAAGYIQYCASAGIIMGKADGYHPNDNVKGLEFAAMLLRALGYGKQGELVGTDWAINTSKFALRLGIFDGNLAGASATEDATREECALYAFNAITNVDKVSYSDLLGGYIVTGTALGSASDANKNSKFKDDFDLKNTKGEDDFDDFGRIDGYYWYVNKPSNRVTDYYMDGEKLKERYTTAITGADIYNLLGSDAIKGAKLSVYIDDKDAVIDTGAETPAANGLDAAYSTAGTDAAARWEIGNFAKGKTKDMYGTGNGVETSVYAWETEANDGAVTKYIRICIVDTYMVKVDKVAKATSTKDAETRVAALAGQGSGPLNGVAMTYETEEFERGDYVLITVSGTEIKSMDPVTVKENTVTRFTDNGGKKSVVSGGETYVASKNAVSDGDLTSAADINKSIVNGKDHELYIDNNGYLIAVADVEAESDYVFVSHFGTKTDVSGSFDSNSVGAKVYYADGTSDIVTVKKINGDATDVDSVNSYSTGLYKLTKSGSKVELDAKGSSGADGDIMVADTYTNSHVKKGIASSIDSGSTYKADKKTVFFYVKGATNVTNIAADEWDNEDFVVTVYTSINTVPANKDEDKADAKSILYEYGETTALAVLVEDKDEGDAKDTVYLYTGKEYSVRQDGDNKIVTFETYVNGEKYDLEITYKKDDNITVYTEKQFFTVNADKSENTSKINGTADINKYKYANGITAVALANINEFDYTLTISGSPKAFRGIDTKVIDLSGNKLDSYDELAAFAADSDNAGKTLSVAIQFGDDNMYLYITDVADTV